MSGKNHTNDRDAWCDICTLKLKKCYIKELALVCASSSYISESGLSVWCAPPKLDVPRTLTFSSVEKRGHELVVKFEEIRCAEQLCELDGMHCIAKKSDICDLDKVQDNSLIGYSLFDADDNLLGVIIEATDMPSQILVTLKRESGRTIDLPIVEEFIVTKDDETRRFVADIPDYLLAES